MAIVEHMKGHIADYAKIRSLEAQIQDVLQDKNAASKALASRSLEIE